MSEKTREVEDDGTAFGLNRRVEHSVSRPTKKSVHAKLFRCGLLAQFVASIALGCVGCAANGASTAPSGALAKMVSPADTAISGSSDVEVEAVMPPEIRVGDVWTDHVLDADREFKVQSVNEDGFFMVDEWGNEILTDKNWNLLTYRSFTFAGAPPTNWKTPLIWFKFPLSPGQTWTQSAHWETPDLNVAGTEEVRGKVIGWQMVKVPAGNYKALRVEIRDRIVGTGGVYDLVTLTYWYVPDVNRFVKYSYHSVYEGEVLAEMVSYKPVAR